MFRGGEAKIKKKKKQKLTDPLVLEPGETVFEDG
jgi:hypothetical protein